MISSKYLEKFLFTKILVHINQIIYKQDKKLFIFYELLGKKFINF